MRRLAEQQPFALVVVLLLTLWSVAAWDYRNPSADWPPLYPSCSGTQQSPVDIQASIPANVLNSSNIVGLRTANHRVYVHRLPCNDSVFGSISAAISRRASGGAVTVDFKPAVPIRIDVRNEDITRNAQRRLVRAVIHSGVEHAYVYSSSSTAVTPAAEVQLVLEALDPVVKPVVFAVRVAFDASVAVPTASDAETDVVTAALAEVVSNQDYLAQHLSRDITWSAGAAPLCRQLLPQSAAIGFKYPGSMSFPPCTEGHTVVVVNDVLAVPQSWQAGILAAAGNDASVRPVQPVNGRIAEAVALSDFVDTPAPATITVQVIDRQSNDRLWIALVSLIAACVALVLYIVLLLSARYEYVQIPTWLGGLSKPPVLWRNPQSAHRRQQNMEDAFGDSEEDEEDEGDDEEDDYGDEEEELEDIEDDEQ